MITSSENCTFYLWISWLLTHTKLRHAVTRSAASEHDTAAFRELMNRETKGTESQSRMNGGRSGGLKTEWGKAENWGAFISWSKLLFVISIGSKLLFVFSIGWLMNVMFVSSLCILTLGLGSRFYNDSYSVKEEPKWSSKLNFIWAPLWRLNWGHTLWRGVWSQSRTQSGVCCD